ncbi:MAG: M23 family metallopeptidase [Proteobacteria bacterium]|jgi:murein DD-endopeptidase MepM/ murein hydrolase activator NlpD|nr:M23 family metallopeptidase [Pseudomonadota bacterium]
MSGIVVPESTIPLTNRGRNASTSTTAHQPAHQFQDILSEATKLQKNKTLPTAQAPITSDKNYTIQQGDTLSEIVAAESKRLGINQSRNDLYNMVSQIADLNHLTSQDSIFPGQKIDLSSIRQPSSDSTSGTIAVLAFPPIFGQLSGPVSRSASDLTAILKNTAEILPKTTFQSPVVGKITSLFGMRQHPVLGEALHHDGIDISQPTGTPVKPLSSGIVTFSGNNGGYGQMVEVDHGNGLTSIYAHLSKLSVRKGEQISSKQTIGQVGQTGMTTGPHLHLEIHRQNAAIDPLTVLNRQQIESNLIFAEARKIQRF